MNPLTKLRLDRARRKKIESAIESNLTDLDRHIRALKKKRFVAGFVGAIMTLAALFLLFDTLERHPWAERIVAILGALFLLGIVRRMYRGE